MVGFVILTPISPQFPSFENNLEQEKALHRPKLWWRLSANEDLTLQ